MIKNSKLYLLIVSVAMIVIVAITSYFYFLQSTKEDLVSSNYKENALALQDLVEGMIYAKQKSTLALALTLATHDTKLSQHIINNNFPDNYYDKLISKYKKNTLYKNIWIQVMDKQGISLYRSWTKKHGDDLRLIRKDIVDVIKKKQPKMSISTGKFDMSIKAIVPIFLEGRFIGMVEVISHFNSIAIELEKNNINSMVLANKEYQKQLKYPWTKTFIGENYLANTNAKKEFIDYLTKHGVANYLGNSYKVENEYLIVSYAIRTNDKKIGTYIMFKKLSDIASGNIDNFIFKWLIFGIFVVIIITGVVNIGMYFILRKQKKYYKSIIDTSGNIVLTNDGNEIIDVNKAFFDYFKKYHNLDEFQNEHSCICDFFVEEENYMQKSMDGVNWVEYLVKHQDEENKIKMNIDGKIVYFLSSASVISEKSIQIAIILSDITQQEIYKHELEQLVVTDVLTKIKNRRYYEQKIQEEIVRSCRYDESLSIIIFDIDFFKKVNDNHGHDIGDKILIEYTRLISSMLRQSDSFCRIGGEEFLIITPHTSKVDAYKLAEKIKKRVEKHKVILPITLSFGVTSHINEEDKDTMFKRADNALYAAKESGRNRVVIG